MIQKQVLITQKIISYASGIMEKFVRLMPVISLDSYCDFYFILFSPSHVFLPSSQLFLRKYQIVNKTAQKEKK